MPSVSNEIGDELEALVAAATGGRRVVQSGGGKWVKLDVTDKGHFVFSCKASRSLKDAAIRAISKLWREAVQGTRGFQGHGDGAKPAMVFGIEEDGEVLVLCRLSDFADMATGAVEPYIPASKAEERRARSRRSHLG